MSTSTATSPSYLITAASGNIGKRLIPLLLSQPSSATLVLPTRNPERLRSQLPQGHDSSRIQIVQGDIQDPIFFETVLREHNVTAVFLCLTGDNELVITLNTFHAMRRAPSVKHLVYLSACFDSSLEAVAAGGMRNVYAGHVMVKYIIEAKLRHGMPSRKDGGFSYTTIGPTLFFDNDLRSKKGLLAEGLFDEPIGSKGVSRVSPADIALAVAKALEDDGRQWDGKKIMIGSLKTYTNRDVVALWSNALGKEIQPLLSTEADLNRFEERIGQFTGRAWARDLRTMYDIFEVERFGMTEQQYAEQVSFLGREPESYEAFVENTAKQWLKE